MEERGERVVGFKVVGCKVWLVSYTRDSGLLQSAFYKKITGMSLRAESRRRNYRGERTEERGKWTKEKRTGNKSSRIFPVRKIINCILNYFDRKNNMLTRNRLKEQIDKLPEEFSTDELVERLILIEKVEKGTDQSKKGEIISNADLNNEIQKWFR